MSDICVRLIALARSSLNYQLSMARVFVVVVVVVVVGDASCCPLLTY